MNQGPAHQDLAQLTALLRERHPGATLLLAGSFARGTPTAFSDFDIISLQSTGAEPFRTAYRFQGRLVEVFCHTEASAVAWMEGNTKVRKTSLASMILDARVLCGDESQVVRIKDHALASVSEGPPAFTVGEDWTQRLAITEALDDLQGLESRNEVVILGTQLFVDVLNYTLVRSGRWTTNGKYHRSALAGLPEHREAFARAIDALVGAQDRAPLVELTSSVLNRFGGRAYESESPPGEVP